MALTKTQINYLENKLNRVVEDKVDKFREKLGEGKSAERIIAEKIMSGELKLLPTTELVKKIKEKFSNSNYYCSIYFTEMINIDDKEQIEKEVRARDKKINAFRDKLYDAKTNALDKIVLEGIDVELALAELDKIDE